MNISRLLALAVVVTASAQVPPASIQPGTPSTGERARSETQTRRVQMAGPPVLGYVTDEGGREIEIVAGKVNAPRLGDMVGLPEGANRVYLPPRQLFALVEQKTNNPMQIWNLTGTGAFGRSDSEAAKLQLAGVTPHPEVVTFSPRGTAALIYSQSDASLQTVSHLPAEPTVGRPWAWPTMNGILSLAVSDDGKSAMIALSDERMFRCGDGGACTALPVSLNPKALSFVPNSHDLVVSDLSRRLIAIIPEMATDFRVVDQNVEADKLAFTKGGEQLVLGSSNTRQVWTIDLQSGNSTAKQSVTSVSTMISMRDGFTFLTATSPAVSVLRFIPAQN